MDIEDVKQLWLWLCNGILDQFQSKKTLETFEFISSLGIHWYGSPEDSVFIHISI